MAGRADAPKANRKRSRKPSKGHGGKSQAGKSQAGLASRLLALEVLHTVLIERRGLDDALDQSLTSDQFLDMEQRDKGFARLLVVTVLRHKLQFQKIIDGLLDRPLKARAARANLILLMGAAQLLKLAAPPHAVIDTAVDLCRQHRSTGGFDRLTNAVLRRVAKPETQEQLAAMTDAESFPDWIIQRWQAAYGNDVTEKIASACLEEAPLDLSVKADLPSWAEALGGIALTTGSIRLKNDGRIEDLPGYEDGAWWVQDAAAALPVHLLGDVQGLKVADFCAAPGGKTAQLAAAGANVVALDVSRKRLQRVEKNLARLGLSAELQVGDAVSWPDDAAAGGFDAVLVDVPCTATGTIRRHPDIIHLKQPDDARKLAELQEKILANAARLLKTNGVLLYCTCSLEPEECQQQIETFLAKHSEFIRNPIDAKELGGIAELVTDSGDLRSLPFHFGDQAEGLRGLDGFYACRLIKQ